MEGDRVRDPWRRGNRGLHAGLRAAGGSPHAGALLRGSQPASMGDVGSKQSAHWCARPASPGSSVHPPPGQHPDLGRHHPAPGVSVPWAGVRPSRALRPTFFADGLGAVGALGRVAPGRVDRREGGGVVPVMGEDLGPLEAYKPDRLFQVPGEHPGLEASEAHGQQPTVRRAAGGAGGLGGVLPLPHGDQHGIRPPLCALHRSPSHGRSRERGLRAADRCGPIARPRHPGRPVHVRPPSMPKPSSDLRALEQGAPGRPRQTRPAGRDRRRLMPSPRLLAV